jgi:hypothetical protein
MLAFLALAAALGMLPILGTLDLRVLYGNEGWSAYHAAEAAAGHNPYPASSALLYNNYPPLFFYLEGALGRIAGDNIFAGRMISAAGFLATALGLAGLARAMGCRASESALAALLFIGLCLYDHGDVGTNDPQCLGHALDVAGLILCVKPSRGVAALAAAALLFVLAFFLKANLVAAPLAATLWLFAGKRRDGIILAVSGAVLAGLGAALFQAAFGQPLWSVLNAPRIWMLASSLDALGGRLPALLPPMLASAALLWRFPKDRALAFCLLYLAVSLATAAWFLGGAGTGGNMLFDALVALSLCGGLGVNRLAGEQKGHDLSPWYAATHVLPLAAIILFTVLTGRFPRYWREPGAEPVVAAGRDVAFLQAQAGPALCKSLTLCFWAGKKEEADLWGYEQAVTLGVRDGHELRQAIAGRRYTVLELGAPPNALAAWPEVDQAYAREIARTIEGNYRIDHTDIYGTFWVRRPF